jgi:hypothetical protein
MNPLPQRLLTASCSLLLAALVVSNPSAVQAAEPGSKDDPIITRSYLDNLHAWQVTNLAEGQTLSLDLGVRFIVRSGKVDVVGNGTSGLLDLSEGRELRDGERVPLNHLIFSPASDRRGLRSATSAVLLTCGLSR